MRTKTTKSVLLFVFVYCSFGAFGQLQNIVWDSVTVKSSLVSCGFLDIADMDNNGKEDIILSTLMEQGSAANQASTKGAIRVFKTSTTSGYPTSWNESVVLPTTSNLPFINTPQVFDVDEDGSLDIMVQQGFLQTNGGSFQWLKGPGLDTRAAFTSDVNFGSTDYFWHESFRYDLDGDGMEDIITTSGNNTVSPTAKRVEWFRHLGNGQFSHYIINDSLGGVFIKLFDVDSDSDMDIVLSQFFGPPAKPSIVWLENLSAPSSGNNWTGNWSYHTIDNTTGLGYYFEFLDVNGDGTTELVYGNHNNPDNTSIVDGNGDPIPSGIYYFDIPANPSSSSQWTKHVIYEGFICDLFDFGNPASQGSPGIWSYGDIDQNGYMDFVLPGDGMAGLYLVRQKSDHSFERELIAGGKMWGMAKVVDFDNNGVPEIVASLHNFPNNFLEALFGLPAGKLMIYRPSNITVGNNSNYYEDNVRIYPNPSSSVINVEADDISELIITDVQGRTVKEESSANLPVIDISDLEIGVYIISIRNKEGIIKKTFVKN